MSRRAVVTMRALTLCILLMCSIQTLSAGIQSCRSLKSTKIGRRHLTEMDLYLAGIKNHGKDGKIFKSSIDVVAGDSSSTGSDNDKPKAKVSLIKPSSLDSINLLMLLFYGTLGSAMPFLPIFYKQLGVSGMSFLY